MHRPVQKDDYFFDRKRESLIRATADHNPGIDMIPCKRYDKNGESGVILVPIYLLEGPFPLYEYLTRAQAELALSLFYNKLI